MKRGFVIVTVNHELEDAVEIFRGLTIAPRSAVQSDSTGSNVVSSGRADVAHRVFEPDARALIQAPGLTAVGIDGFWCADTKGHVYLVDLEKLVPRAHRDDATRAVFKIEAAGTNDHPLVAGAS